MTRIAVAGVLNIRTAWRIERFPVSLVSRARSNAIDNGGLSVAPGGSGWTVARTLQQLGDEVVFATYVGADALGAVAVSALREHGLYGPTTLRCADQPRAVVLYDRAGHRAGVSDLRSTPGLSYPAEEFDQAIAGCGFAVLTNIGFTRPLIPVAVDRGLPIATDLHIVDDVDDAYNRPWLAAGQVVACSHEGLPCSAEDWVSQVWRRFGTPVVLVGCGADGAVVGVRETGTIWQVHPTTPRGVRYVNGAGDTLLGSFTHHYAALGDAVDAARHAVLTAGWYVGGGPEPARPITAARLATIREDLGLPPATRLR
ncbi:MAG TPA: carbohydrate kinase family protein [Pseudonocardiaceae bacterium]|nr:carbohydrate kinase family protein [Pseudonocardiaceae bacterium]